MTGPCLLPATLHGDGFIRGWRTWHATAHHDTCQGHSPNLFPSCMCHNTNCELRCTNTTYRQDACVMHTLPQMPRQAARASGSAASILLTQLVPTLYLLVVAKSPPDTSRNTRPNSTAPPARPSWPGPIWACLQHRQTDSTYIRVRMRRVYHINSESNKYGKPSH